MAKRYFVAIILLLCISLFFVGCDIIFYNFNNYANQKPQSPRDISIKMQDDVSQYLKNGDARYISELFCDAVPVSVEEIQGLLGFFDGDIVKIEEGPVNSGKKISEEGVYTVYTFVGELLAVTDKSKEYEVFICGASAYRDNPAKIGLSTITVVDRQSDEHYDVGLY